MWRVPGIATPFVVFAALQCLVLVALGLFIIPPLAPALVPAIERLGGEAALHYPMHFILLPDMFHTVYLVLFVVPGFILFGMGVAAMAEYVAGRDRVSLSPRPSLAASVPAMIAAGVAYTVCAAGIPVVFAVLADRVEHPMLARLFAPLGLALSMAAQALLVYALVYIRTRTRNPFAAIRHSVALGRSRFFVTALLIATVMIVHAPLNYVIAHADGLAIKFRPELVLYVLIVGVVVELVTNLMLFAATTSVALSRREVGIR